MYDRGDSDQAKTTVSSVHRKYRQDFPGTTLPSDWTFTAGGVGSTATVANSTVTIAAGTSAGTSTLIHKVPVNAPCRVQVLASFARASTVTWNFGLVDEDGTEVAGTYAQWSLTGSGTTGATTQTANSGNTGLNAGVSITGSTTMQQWDIDLFADEVLFATRPMNSQTSRAVANVGTQRIPGPGANLYFRIQCINTGTTTLNGVIDSVNITDIHELTTEITGGRGGGAAQAIPVMQMAAPVGNTIVTMGTISAVQSSPTIAATAATIGSTSFGPAIDFGTTASRTYYRAFTRATGGPFRLLVQASSDNTNFATVYRSPADIAAGGGDQVDVPICARYYRMGVETTTAVAVTAAGQTQIALSR